jgi:hypothetical protein
MRTIVGQAESTDGTIKRHRIEIDRRKMRCRKRPEARGRCAAKRRYRSMIDGQLIARNTSDARRSIA